MGILMLFVVVLGVFFRYALNQPIFWSQEVAVILLLWSIFLGGFYTYLEGGHVSVNFVVDKLGEKTRKIALLVMDILSFILLLIIFKDGLRIALNMMGTKTPALRLPIAIPLLSVPVGAFLMAGVAAKRTIVRIGDLFRQSPKMK
jgi:TRAP-type C4-dicarboxylate transport system permease small subunit